MTEEEAKTKVCPIAMLRVGTDGNWDKGACIGSACMWWRWGMRPEPKRITVGDSFHIVEDEPERPANVPPDWQWQEGDFDGHPSAWVEPQSVADLRREGYCGRAGPR